MCLGRDGLCRRKSSTEIVRLMRKKVPTIVKLQVATETIVLKEAVKYLRDRLDIKLTFSQHIFVSENAEGVISALSRLMANIGGPASSK